MGRRVTIRHTSLPGRLTDATQPVFALVYIAEAKGYFAHEGLDIS